MRATISSSKRLGVAGDAEGAVVHVAAGAAGDLADFFRPQRAHADAVEFLQAGKRDVVDVHVDAHADGVGRHQKIDIAGLIELRPAHCACAG